MRQIYFDLDGDDKTHRAEITRFLEQTASHADTVEVTDARGRADLVVVTRPPRITDGLDRLLGSRGRPEEGVFTWSRCDRPAGRYPGLYCSLSRRQFDPARHDTFTYPVTHNELVEHFDPADAEGADSYDWTFFGGMSATVRKRLVQELGPRADAEGGHVVVQGAAWHQQFDRSGADWKREYVEALRRSKFFVCPRGQGQGSIRLFETMRAGRVPVVVADRYVMPSGVDWEACSLRVAEADVAQIPQLVREALPRWRSMAEAARREWEGHFSPAVVLDQVAERLGRLRDGESRLYPLRVATVLGRDRAARLVGMARSRVRRAA